MDNIGVKAIYVTGPPATGKTLFSKRVLLYLIRRRRKAVYINVGSYAVTNSLVTEYDFIHDTYTIDYSKVVDSILSFITLVKNKIGETNLLYALIDSHDACFFNELSRKLVPDKVILLIPSSPQEYEKMVHDKNWPLPKILENKEFVEYGFYLEDNCYEKLVEVFNPIILTRPDITGKEHSVLD